MQEYEIKLLAARIAGILRTVDDADRVATLAELPFCPGCGVEDRQCQCQNDE